MRSNGEDIPYTCTIIGPIHTVVEILIQLIYPSSHPIDTIMLRYGCDGVGIRGEVREGGCGGRRGQYQNPLSDGWGGAER